MSAVRSFRGCEEMVEVVDAAVKQPALEQLTEQLKDGLCELIRSGRLELPEEVMSPCGDHYARRLLYRSDEHGYTVVAMTWGPGQGTPLHDHAGTWCVEGVLDGDIEVTRYDLLESAGERWRFERKDTVLTGPGTAGSLIPPFEYHTIRNASGERNSVTLHVYGGELASCTIFEPLAEDWYLKKTRSLGYDA